MKFHSRLDEAIDVVPYEKIDKRLDTDSEISPISHKLEKMAPMPQSFRTEPSPVISGKKGKLYLHDSVEVSDDILREYPEREPGEEEEFEELGEGRLEDEPEEDVFDDEGGDFDLDDLESEQIPGTPGGGGYSIGQAAGQLDGVLKRWMDIAGTFPEGKRRHDFLEIGERLREISGVLRKDFIERQMDD